VHAAPGAEELAKLARNGGIGHIFHAGQLPVNAQLAAYDNVARPANAPDWQTRAQAQLMFPK
jgi:hypothetical protein